MSVCAQVREGSLFGAILLISGCCIGAGMLGLPMLASLAGFKPSIFLFFLGWLYMTFTGFLLLEITLHFRDETNVVTMANLTLGKIGKIIAWSGYLFLFYSLMVAYISGCGELITALIASLTGLKLPVALVSLVSTAILSIALYLGTQAIDQLNRLFMLGLVISYIALVIFAFPRTQPLFLSHVDWSQTLPLLPIIIIAFGYHNLVPTITSYLSHNVYKLRLTLLIGSLIPLFIYILWEYLILGMVPLEGKGGFREGLENEYLISEILKLASGPSWVVSALEYFAFFALVTSFLGVALSFMDFLSDGLQIRKLPKGKTLLCTLVVLPPFLFSQIYPSLFLKALGYAGGIGAVTLFGILPALMAWSGRYNKKLWEHRLVPGGRPLLIALLLFSIGVIVLQLLEIR